MIKVGKTLLSLPMILFMFVLIYNPPLFAPLFRANSIWLVMLPSALYLLLSRQALRRFVSLRRVGLAGAVLGALLLYLVVLAKLNGNDPAFFSFFVYWLAGVIPFALSCWVALRKRDLGFESLLDHLLLAGLLQAAAAVASFLLPPVKEFFTEKMIAYGLSRIVAVKLSAYRNFGLAANLTSTAAYVQCFLACVALFRGVRGRPRWLFAFPVLAFSANINGRTSVWLLLFGLASVLVSLFFSESRAPLGRFFLALAPALLLAFFGVSLIRLVNPMTHEWLSRGLEQVSTFVAGEETPYADGFFGELAWMLLPEHFPRGVNLVFGAGTEIMGGIVEEKYGAASDIGFMNDLWRGGLLYLAVTAGLFLRALWRVLRCPSVPRDAGVFLALVALAFFGITNFKGSFFIHSDLTAVLWILAVPLLWNRQSDPRPPEIQRE